MGAELPKHEWARWSDDRLLDLRLSDLKLSLKGTLVEKCKETLYQELKDRGLKFRPHLWISDEWYTPNGVPGIAVPFYLAHPRLAQLEMTQMFEVEGGTEQWCLQILRHEAGHAIENAFGLRRRKKRQQVFGKSTQTYPSYYSPKPYSKKYVQHLDSWYAQSHPDEDFAETFAVWLTPDADWQERYQGWAAMKKLSYMNELMSEIAGKKPTNTSRIQIDQLAKLNSTLRRHYAAKRKRMGMEPVLSFDPELTRLFSNDNAHRHNMTAARFLRRIRRHVRREIARGTGEYQYTIDGVIETIIRRTEELGLRLTKSEAQTQEEFLVLVTVQTMNYLHSGHHRVAL